MYQNNMYQNNMYTNEIHNDYYVVRNKTLYYNKNYGIDNLLHLPPPLLINYAKEHLFPLNDNNLYQQNDNNMELLNDNNMKLLNDYGTEKKIKDNYEEFLEITKNCDTLILGEKFKSDISKIPENIKYIIFSDCNNFCEDPNYMSCFYKGYNFHNSVKKIRFRDDFNESIDNLPSSLEELEFSPNSIFNKSVDNLPCTLKKITFGKHFNIPINNLPQNLEYLNIQSEYFSVELKNIPPGLKYLFFNSNPKYSYEKKIEGLPEGLIEITYPFEYPFEINNLPNSVKIIRISNIYKYVYELKLMYPNKKIIVY